MEPDLPPVEEVPIRAIRFSTGKIPARFDNGQRISDVVEDLRTYRLSVSDFPWIRIIKHEAGGWWTLDNRRLYAFRTAGIDNINCIDCTSSEKANAELSSKLAQLTRDGLVLSAGSDSDISKMDDSEFSQLTQKFVDWIVQIDLESLAAQHEAPSSSEGIKPIPDAFESWNEYSEVLLSWLRVEVSTKLAQSVKAAARSRSQPSTGNKDRYPGIESEASITKFTPRAARDNFRSDIISLKVSSVAALRVSDAVLIKWRDVAGDARPQLGVVVYCNSDSSEVQIKLAMRPSLADAIDAKLVPNAKGPGVTLRVQAIDNLVSYSRIWASLQWKSRQKAVFEEIILQSEPKRLDSLQRASLGELEYWAESQRGFNPSQLHALQAVAEQSNPLVLIQGPPGTGKTSTILGACAVLLFQGKRVLVTSPSNHAVDSIARECLNRGLGPVHYKPPMALVGAADSIALTGGLENIFVDTRIRRSSKTLLSIYDAMRPQVSLNLDDLDDLIYLVEKEAALPAGLKRKLIVALEAMAAMYDSEDLFERMRSSFATFCTDTIVSLRLPSTADFWARKMVRDSRLVFATISSTGRSVVRASGAFDCVVVDESTQSPEAETAILSMLRMKRLILVGDPKQLSGTVTSTAAKKAGFARSLMERLMHSCGHEAILLKTQYRMHDEIARFSNQHFYDGELVTADSVKQMAHPLRPIVFFDVFGAESGGAATESESISNLAEAQVVGEIVHVLLRHDEIEPISIGVITPYGAQVKLIASTLAKAVGNISKQIEVNTVDGFQGREKEIIIISFVRSNPRGQIGFVQDAKRLNVSLTRSKHSLILVGSHSTLQQSDPRSPVSHFARHVESAVVNLMEHRIISELEQTISAALFKESHEATRLRASPGSRSSEPLAHANGSPASSSSTDRSNSRTTNLYKERGQGDERGSERGPSLSQRGRGRGGRSDRGARGQSYKPAGK